MPTRDDAIIAPSRVDQLLAEIQQVLQTAELRRALDARQGELVLSWANGHVTYVEARPRYKVGVDIGVSAEEGGA